MNLMNSFKKCVAKRQYEDIDSGRSMVEMLGVLAIIGVLSIGGIMGYKYAMAKYQANQLVAEVNFIRNDMEQQMGRGNNTVSLGDPYGEAGQDEGNVKTNNYPIEYNCGEGICPDRETCTPICKYEDEFYFDIFDMPKDICRQFVPLVKNIPNLKRIQVNETEGGSAADCEEYIPDDSKHYNAIALVFGIEQTAQQKPTDYCDRNGDCVNGNKCYDSTCGCRSDKECKEAGEHFTCREDQKCAECKTNDECVFIYGNAKPVCAVDTCIECPEKYVYIPEIKKCVDGCRSNDNCEKDYFCYAERAKTTGLNIEFGAEDKYGKCVSVAEFTRTPSSASDYVLSNKKMPYWSANRFCEAKNMKLMDFTDLKCAKKPYGDNQYCKKTTSSQPITTYEEGNKPEIMIEVDTKYTLNEDFVWTAVQYGSNGHQYAINKYGRVRTNGYRNGDYTTAVENGLGWQALCAPK